MTTVRATTKNAAVVPADRIAIWPALTDPRQLPELTPLLRRTHTDGAAWTCMRISALGVGITPSFTERMSCTEGERIEYRHEPARGVSERTGAAGWYQLSDAAAGTGFRSASPCISGCRCPPPGAGDGRASRRAPATDSPRTTASPRGGRSSAKTGCRMTIRPIDAEPPGPDPDPVPPGPDPDPLPPGPNPMPPPLPAPGREPAPPLHQSGDPVGAAVR